METTDTNIPGRQGVKRADGRGFNQGNVALGFFIVLIGLLLLFRKAGVHLPGWIFSFETILIALGLYLGIRHSFRGFGWMIPILIGGFLLIDEFYPYYDIAEFTWPIVIIGIGLFIIFRPGRRGPDWQKRWEADHAPTESLSGDYLDSTAVFGGVKKNIISKNFRGGESVTVFGGTEINLMQADFSGPIILEVTQLFGGTKLIVPSHWKVQSTDLVAILGSVDDKRPVMGTIPEDTDKVLILKGTCMLGGIEIRSY